MKVALGVFMEGVWAFVGMKVSAQSILYEDIFHGGVTAGRFSTGLGAGSGEVEFHIEPGSTIRRVSILGFLARNVNALIGPIKPIN
ncbi:MAG: hypothetical protein EA392_00760, partial [Cryomorphaceae bacterium]